MMSKKFGDRDEGIIYCEYEKKELIGEMWKKCQDSIENPDEYGDTELGTNLYGLFLIR